MRGKGRGEEGMRGWRWGKGKEGDIWREERGGKGKEGEVQGGERMERKGNFESKYHTFSILVFFFTNKKIKKIFE